MFTQSINTVQRWVYESFETLNVHSLIDHKVHSIGRKLLSVKSETYAKKEISQSFSPMRYLWWASLLNGVRAQSTDPFPAQFELSTLDGTNGFVIHGEGLYDQLGSSVSGLGDVNADGMNDIIIGAYTATYYKRQFAGKTYILFGSPSIGGSGHFDLSSLNGTQGFIINGFSETEELGYSVSGLEDFNGDEVSDFVIGTGQLESNSPMDLDRYKRGEAYVFFGGKGIGIAGMIDTTIFFGKTGFTLRGKEPKVEKNFWEYGLLGGYEVDHLGDINRDGFSDFVIFDDLYRSNDGNRNGKIYVLFGGTSMGFSLNWYELDNFTQTNGLYITGQQRGLNYDSTVSGVGDVNGDGFDDILVGSPRESLLGVSDVGKAYLIYGGRHLKRGETLDLSKLDPQNGFIFTGGFVNDSLGAGVSGVGDVNGDGLNDFILKSLNTGRWGVSGKGILYLLMGKKSFDNGGIFNISNMNADSGFLIYRSQDDEASFKALSSAGDLNGDGYDDILIGVPEGDAPARSSAGNVYVVFGGVNITSQRMLDLSSLNGSHGFEIIGEFRDDSIGKSLSSAKDINGDGVDDLIIGAPRGNSPGIRSSGKTYVIFGRNLTQQIRLPTHTHINSPVDSKITPTVIGVSAGGAALLCSLVAGGVFFFWKKKNGDQAFYQNFSIHQKNPIYHKLDLVPPPDEQQGGSYVNLSANPGGGQYADWPEVPQEHDSNHYSDVEVLNRQHDQYVIDKRVKAQDSYDDLNDQGGI